MSKQFDNMDEIVRKHKEARSKEEAIELEREYWAEAIDFFNENISGDFVQKGTGKRLKNPPID